MEPVYPFLQLHEPHKKTHVSTLFLTVKLATTWISIKKTEMESHNEQGPEEQMNKALHHAAVQSHSHHDEIQKRTLHDSIY